MTKEQLFKKSYAIELQRIAKGDLESAEGMLESKKGRPENVCYMAQQAIEKSIKALLCHLGEPIPFSHSIELLLDRLPGPLQPKEADALIVLTDFATIRRYNEGNEIITEEDMKATLSATKRLLDFVALQLNA